MPKWELTWDTKRPAKYDWGTCRCTDVGCFCKNKMIFKDKKEAGKFTKLARLEKGSQNVKLRKMI